MKHFDCKNYIHLDCEKGMCAISKAILPIDGEGSQSCPSYTPAPKCGGCVHFRKADGNGIGTCTAFAKHTWAYASCGASGCERFEQVQ